MTTAQRQKFNIPVLRDLKQARRLEAQADLKRDMARFDRNYPALVALKRAGFNVSFDRWAMSGGWIRIGITELTRLYRAIGPIRATGRTASYTEGMIDVQLKSVRYPDFTFEYSKPLPAGGNTPCRLVTTTRMVTETNLVCSTDDND